MVRVIRNERGGGLLMALFVIVALAALAAGIISAVSTDRRMTSYNMTRGKALSYAEAGVAEAMERIRAGDVPDNRNPKMVSQIFLANAGSMPTFSTTDTIAIATAQPAGAWLPYTTDTKNADALTVQYMTNAARTGIYFYDATKNPPIQGKTGSPVFQIHSVSTAGISRRAIDATVTPLQVTPNLKGAIVSNEDLKLHGADTAIGYDYSADTPDGTGNDYKRHTQYETGGTNTTGAWSAKKVDVKAPSVVIGTPNSLQNQTGFYAGPWEALNMGQAQFYSWVGPPLLMPKNNGLMPSGITYLGDPKDKPQQGKKKFQIKGGSGEGLLYVNGDLELDSDFVFRGLIYVEGALTVKGQGWILGCLVVADDNHMKTSHHNTLTVLKSDQAVSQFVSQHGTPFVTLNWREN